jgi:two-component system chemotaxis response regulator CheY
VASSIGRDPKSWKGWHCLLVKSETDEIEIAQDCLVWAKAVVESYLKGSEGRIYAYGNGNIHIICRDAGRNLLEQVGSHIRDYINAENQIFVSFIIYDLEADGFAYASNVLADNGDILSPEFSIFSQKKLKESHNIFAFSSNLDNQNISNRRDFTKVLLIEDDPVTRWMVRHALKDQCQLATAPTAGQAFVLYQAWKPDVVFLDINLPDKNGLDVLKWIKSNDPGAYVVMFSSANNMDNITGALEDGASGFVAKPFLKDSLLHYINRQIGIRYTA